jgi:hypothetical protein
LQPVAETIIKCFLIISLNSNNLSVFVTVTQCLICEARIQTYSNYATDKRPRTRAAILNNGKKFFSFQSVLTGSGNYPAPYSTSTGVSSPEIKGIAKIKDVWSYTSATPHAIMAQ